MVDFTALASRVDPEELDAVMRTYEDTCIAAIERYDGYVHNRLGDGIVAFFGYPLAHERGAERSIRAATRDPRTAGAHRGTGRRPSAGQGRHRLRRRARLARRPDALSGETLNLASRLQNVAGIGQVAVSSRIRQPGRRRVRLRRHRRDRAEGHPAAGAHLHRRWHPRHRQPLRRHPSRGVAVRRTHARARPARTGMDVGTGRSGSRGLRRR